MALTDTFVKQVKHSGKLAGEKHTDGKAMYLLVNATGKYWRMSYRFDGKQKTLALGVYPAVSLANARERRDNARRLIANGVDPVQVRASGRQRQIQADKTPVQAFKHDGLTASERPAAHGRPRALC